MDERADRGPVKTPRVGRYANAFRVGFNAFELVIEFGEKFSDDSEARIHTRIITNPVFANELGESLNDALARYARAYSARTADERGGS